MDTHTVNQEEIPNSKKKIRISWNWIKTIPAKLKEKEK